MSTLRVPQGATLNRGVNLLDGPYNISASNVDNRAGVQAFFDTLPAGSSVTVPVGTFNITGHITVSGNDLRIYGESRDGAVLNFTPTTANTPCFTITGNDVTIETLGFDATATPVGGCSAVEFVDNSRGSIERCRIRGGHYGLWFNNTVNDYSVNFRHQARFNLVSDCVASGIQVSQGADIDISGNDCNNNGRDGIKTAAESKNLNITHNWCEGNARDGIDVYDGFIGSALENNICVGNTYQGIEVKGNYNGSVDEPNYPYLDHPTRQSTVVGNICDGNGSGVAPGMLLQNLRNVTVTGNQAINGSQNGFTFVGNQACTFIGNGASRNAQHGFDIQSSDNSQSMFIANQSFDNWWGGAGGTAYHGFNIDAGSAGNFIGNHSGNKGNPIGQRGAQSYGFYFSGVAGGGTSFLGNETYNNVDGGIGGTDAGFVATCNMMNNRFEGAFRGWKFTEDDFSQMETAARMKANVLGIEDGVSTPTTEAGTAYIFIDTADGLPKIKYGNGTVETITTS